MHAEFILQSAKKIEKLRELERVHEYLSVAKIDINRLGLDVKSILGHNAMHPLGAFDLGEATLVGCKEMVQRRIKELKGSLPEEIEL